MDGWEFIQVDHYNKIVNAAKESLRKYGTLRWCSGGICACMGCVNSMMSENDYHEALSIPEIQALMPFPFPVEVDVDKLREIFK